jgi:Phage portal protein
VAALQILPRKRTEQIMKFLPWQSRAAQRSEKRDALEVQGGGGLSNLSAIWSFLDGGNGLNESDEVVNDATALSISTVFTCCRVLSDGVASLPCKVYKQTANGKMEDTDARLSHLLQLEANPETSSYSYFETLVTHLMLRGNAYSEIQRDAAGNPVSLWNLDPRKCEPVRLGLNGDLAYKTWDGMEPGQTHHPSQRHAARCSVQLGWHSRCVTCCYVAADSWARHWAAEVHCSDVKEQCSPSHCDHHKEQNQA